MLCWIFDRHIGLVVLILLKTVETHTLYLDLFQLIQNCEVQELNVRVRSIECDVVFWEIFIKRTEKVPVIIGVIEWKMGDCVVVSLIKPRISMAVCLEANLILHLKFVILVDRVRWSEQIKADILA